MNNTYDYQQFALLYVDDEVQTVSNFHAYFSDTFDVVTATSGEEAWKIFSENPNRFAIVMSDQRMPASTGVELLEKVRTARPRVLRILATAYADIEAAIAAVNNGAIYKYVTKPWDPPSLEISLKRGMEFFLVQRERDSLMKEKMSALQRLMMTDRLLSLGIFAAGLNHHLRNSLTAVKTFLDLAPFHLQGENVDINNLRNPNYWRDFYVTVQSQIGKVVTLLKDINDIPEPAGMPLVDTVSVNEAVNAAWKSQAGAFREKNIDVRFTLSDAAEVKGNRGLIEKAINLLLIDEHTNVPAFGALTVETAAHTDESGRTGVMLRISDNGPGVTSSNLNCIFDPFFVRQNNPEEYGLNLLTCFFIIYHHSGSMTVERSQTGGACFQIFLPQQPREEASTQETFLERVFDMEKTWEKMLISG